MDKNLFEHEMKRKSFVLALSGVVLGIGLVYFALFFSVAGAATGDDPARFEEKGGIAQRTKSQVVTDEWDVIPGNKEALRELFADLYVKQGQRTDCSFVSAFMLLIGHDPDYPYKVMRANQDGSYTVRFPGCERSFGVTKGDMERFYSVIEKKRKRADGYTPPGIEILRCAYYRYQRETGQRPREYDVYVGGWPIRDLLVLSGIKKGGILIAHRSNDDVTDTQNTFAGSMLRVLEVTLSKGAFHYKYVEEAKESGNPLDCLGDLSRYFIVLSSTGKVSRIERFFGNKIIPNHAYYLIAELEGRRYLLGDSYDTRNPLIVKE